MGDFYQNGIVTTLHNLTSRPLDELESELLGFSSQRPIGLVLPCLYSELQGPALGHIVEELSRVKYLKKIVIALDSATEAQFIEALSYFAKLPQDTVVLWNDGPRLKKVDQVLFEHGLSPTEMGKGRNVWFCFGYTLACNAVESVALHDCDILNYDRELLARLVYPVAHPNFNYEFCKGYYTRIANRKMHGRVSRLLVTPLIRALRQVCGPGHYLDYMDSFRYPLSGEFSLRKDVLRDIRIPSDWGLEIGVLSEMYRNYSTNRLCQVDIADVYDHKHQDVSAEDANRGLSKMSLDIAKTLFRKLATNGEIFSTEKFRTLKAAYYRIALDFIETYANDAEINGLDFDRHSEEMAVEVFAQNVVDAGAFFLHNPMDTPFVPSWNRVISAIPGIQDILMQAVEEDRQHYTSQIS
ncbi:MAG: glycosyl transferase [Gammaproteobacteria bacterium]|nr:glycosyl transferase [Gammaproteobacteria bacterium]